MIFYKINKYDVYFRKKGKNHDFLGNLPIKIIIIYK